MLLVNISVNLEFINQKLTFVLDVANHALISGLATKTGIFLAKP